MKIATYNVNSINARMENLANWLKKTNLDIVLLQEIKTEFNNFPFFDIQALGYNVVILGQKSYNGVAILSKHKIRLVQEGLPNFDDDSARYIEADIVINDVEYRVASVYLPNGNPPYNAPEDNSKFEYKLRWMEAFYDHSQKLLSLYKPVILGGDYNVILTPLDVYDEEAFKNNALYRSEVRQRFRAIEYLGWYDAFRMKYPKKEGYTYWDYAGAALQNNDGLRIDYMLLSPDAADKLQNIEVDKSPRQGIKPSDHTPLVAEFG